MSFNQSRSTDKSDTQYRKTGRSTNSNQQRGSSGSFGRGSGGGGPASSPLITSSSSSLSSNRSFRKSYNNAHGGQTRINSPPGNPAGSSNSSLQRPVQNGSHVPSQLHGASDASVATATVKTSEPSSVAPSSAQAVQKAPTPQSTSPLSSQRAPVSSAQAAPPTSNKEEAAKTMTLQFGSLNASVMNGMQIPARTSSAPPNLDEQKHDQARHESYRTVPSFPIPAVPKHQPPPKKDPVVVEQPYTGDTLSATKAKKDQQVPPAPPVNQMHKPSVHPITGMSIPLPFHHSQGSVQFGGHNPQIQSQGMSTASLQMPMPMPLHMGNAPQLQQQVFVPGLQAHHMPQGLMQGQSMNFTAQMGPLLGSQLGNMGISMPPQYAQQQGGKFGGTRKTTVKITHPETHEVLRLDKRAETIDGGSSGTRTHANVHSQSQPISSFGASHPISYYPPSSYGTSSLFFPPPNSLPLTSNQVTNSQPSRFNYQANHGHQNVAIVNPSSHNMLPANKTGRQAQVVVDQVDSEHAHDLQNGILSTSSRTTSATPKPSVKSAVDSWKSNSSISVVAKCESQMMKELGETGSMSSARDSETSSEQSKHGSDSVVTQSSPKESVVVSISKSTDNLASGSSLPSSMSEESLPVGSNNKSMREPLSGSNSMKDHYQKQGRKGQLQQVGGQSLSVSGSPSNDGASVVQNIVSEKSASTSGICLSVLIPPEKPSGTGDTPADSTERGSFSNPSEVSGAQTHHDKSEELFLEGDISKFNKLINRMGDEQNVPACSNDISRSMVDSEHLSLNQIAAKEAEDVSQKNAAVTDEVSCSEMVQKSHVEVVKDNKEKAEENLGFDTSKTLGCKDIVSDSENSNSVGSNSVSADSDVSNPQTTFSSTVPKETAEHRKEVDNVGDGLGSLPGSCSKDKPILEQNKAKPASKGRKKMKEILQKADALGTSTDLYNAYKGPEERKEAIELSDSSESTTVASLSQMPTDTAQEDPVATDSGRQMKAEPEDWEDAAEMSSPKLKVTEEYEQVGDGSGTTAKKYSRDFLMKFAEQCYDLPQGFEITADIAEALMSASVSSVHLVERDSYPSPGRITDRHGGASRLDRRSSGVFEDDRWSKASGPFVTGRERMDTAFGNNAGFHSAQGGNSGVIKNPRAQNPLQYSGGILSGPIQGMGPQGGRRNSPDAERWQRATNFQQKGLIPSPQIPMQVMHRAEKKYEVGKVAGEEEVKQRQLKAILNKLTPQNFEKLFEQVKAVNIDNAVTLTGVISQIFDKALMEPTFCEMYANFCSRLASELPDLSEDNEKITFKRLLLNKCQEEFERGEREQEEANKADDESETKLSEEQREEKRLKARRRMLGNIRLIGELYKKRMLTERIMHECIKKLLGQYQDPDEEDLEALCKLMSTIGEMIDHAKAKEHMDAYFERMKLLSNNMNLSSRVRFMLKDALDLRKNKWQQRRKIEGPKKIEEVHRDAAQERQAQATRLSRGPGINSSARRAPMDFGPRSPMISPPGAHLGGYRGLPAQPRGYPSQDVRSDDRLSFDGRTFSIPLAHRPTADDSITLGPQGGLARGMSIRGPPTMPGASVADGPFAPGDSRRTSAGLNGYSNVPERTHYGSREELMPRSTTERLSTAAVYSQSNAPERNLSFGSQDLRNLDRSVDRALSVPSTRTQGSKVSSNTSEKLWPEERMRDMSMQAIKEFYSARDEREVALCVEDLNAPSFHSSMVSLWVTDSFERKDIERELLAKLLVNLAKSWDGILSQVQLINGFESVLATLEDAVNDAPRAPEFLGNLFAKVILENVISLKEIGRLLYQGGEEPGLLREAGLAGDVLGSTLEAIQSDKGDNVLNEIRTSSSLRLEDFRPPDPLVSKKLEKFI